MADRVYVDPPVAADSPRRYRVRSGRTGRVVGYRRTEAAARRLAAEHDGRIIDRYGPPRIFEKVGGSWVER